MSYILYDCLYEFKLRDFLNNLYDHLLRYIIYESAINAISIQRFLWRKVELRKDSVFSFVLLLTRRYTRPPPCYSFIVAITAIRAR